ncbi:MAG: alpha-galactosidase [Clostridia bacterium]|nr:alpha-galactosidase [Clostridia bacterium]
MPINFDSNTKTFHIQTPNTSYAFRLRGEHVLEHLYYGKRLESLEGMFTYDYSPFVSGVVMDSEFIREDERTGAEASAADCEGLGGSTFVSSGVLCQEYPTFGSCDTRRPGFHATYGDGSRTTKLTYVSHKIYDSKPKLEGLPSTYVESDDEAKTLEILFKDEVTGLEFLHRYTAYTNLDVITRNIEVTNKGNAPAKIQRIMSMSFDFFDHNYDLICLHGAWGREAYIERSPLTYGCRTIENRGVCRSHGQRPFFALARKDSTETTGDIYGFDFVYSGNFECGVEVERYGAARAFMGIGSTDFLWHLDVNEKFVAPEVVMVYSANGMGEMSRTYHELYRTRLAKGPWRDKERPVLINNWEATYMDFTEEKLLELASQAVKAGIEMLVVDDGWYRVRNDETCSLGDWNVNLKKMPSGLKGFGEKLNAMGLKFGLWFEPEMICPDSDIYRAHPDWCLHAEGRDRNLARYELAMDLSREDVREYIIGKLTDILSSAPIEYVKWDVNRDLTEIGSAKLPPERQGEITHRYMLGLYEILERIMGAFPNILFEGCAGGGGRFDAGMMHYFQQYWASDDSDAGERMLIQHGTSVVMPSAFVTSHVSAVPNHQIGRTTSMKMRGYMGMAGQLGYELDITKMSDDELLEIKAQIEQNKEIREIVHKGDLYRLKSPFESNYAVWEYISKDEKTVVLFYFKTRAVPGFERNMQCLEALDENATYKLRGTDEKYNGKVLMNYGLCVEQKHAKRGQKMEDFSGKLLIFDKI